MNPGRWAGATALVLSGLMFVYGSWALMLPHSFYRAIAHFEPYNEHFLHDAGALQVGIAVSLLLGAVRASGLTAALGGFVAFEVLHVGSHVVDHGLGGVPWRDIPFLAAMALAGAWALASHLSQERRKDGV